MNNWLLGYWNGKMDQAYFNGWVSNNGSGPTADSNRHMYETTIDDPSNSNNSTVYVYDTRNPTVQQLFSNASGQQGPNGLELNGYSNGGELSDCNVAEVLIYSGILDSAVAQTEAYLASKYWGAALPGGVASAGNNVLPFGTPLAIAAGATLDLNGLNQQVASLADYGPGGFGAIANSNTGASVLTLSASGGATTFSGTIDGSSSGAISLVMSGSGRQVLAGSFIGPGSLQVDSGTLVLSGSNGYSGGTLVEAGTLIAAAAALFRPAAP